MCFYAHVKRYKCISIYPGESEVADIFRLHHLFVFVLIKAPSTPTASSCLCNNINDNSHGNNYTMTKYNYSLNSSWSLSRKTAMMRFSIRRHFKANTLF